MKRSKRIIGVQVLLFAAVLLAVCAGHTFWEDETPQTDTALPVEQTVQKQEPRLQEEQAPQGEHALLAVSPMSQYPTLPTGCESTAAAMVLQYWGETVTAQTFAADWLAKGAYPYEENGVLYGGDPQKVFVGDPFSERGFGCFSFPIVQAVNQHSELCHAERVVGLTLNRLCEDYIDKGIPVVVWATMEMTEPKEGRSWYLPDGSLYTWMSGEHCLVLIGYNETSYFFCDPRSGGIVGYAKGLCESRFQAMGAEAVKITKG